MRRLFVGFDPGVNGGICILNKFGEFIAATRMPITTTLKHDGGKSNFTCEYGIKEFLSKHVRPDDKVHAGVEHVTVLQPPIGRKANWVLGHSFGVCIASCVFSGFSLILIPPKVWQDMTFPNVGAKADKAKSLSYARRRWTAMAPLLQSKNTDGVAESGIIADCTRMITLKGSR